MSEINTTLARALRDAGVTPNGRPWKAAKEMIAAGNTDLEAIATVVRQAAQPDELLKPKGLGCSDLECEHGRCAALRQWGTKKGIVQVAAPKASKAKKGTKKAASKKATQAPEQELMAKLAERPEVMELLSKLLA